MVTLNRWQRLWTVVSAVGLLSLAVPTVLTGCATTGVIVIRGREAGDTVPREAPGWLLLSPPDHPPIKDGLSAVPSRDWVIKEHFGSASECEADRVNVLLKLTALRAATERRATIEADSRKDSMFDGDPHFSQWLERRLAQFLEEKQNQAWASRCVARDDALLADLLGLKGGGR